MVSRAWVSDTGPIDQRLEAARVKDLAARTADEPDHYAALGLESTADAEAIRRAYQEAVARFHPLKNYHLVEADGAMHWSLSRAFLRVQEAYHVLSSPERRRVYDNAFHRLTQGYRTGDLTGKLAEIAQRQEEAAPLHQALERRELRLHYQPIVSLVDWQIQGFEALVRWAHPTGGLLGPSHFVEVAERTGLIGAIGKWVLGEACRQLRAWQAEFPRPAPLCVSVNLSSRQLFRANLAQTVFQVLDEAGIDPQSLKLEITETALIEDTDAAFRTLAQLLDLGIRIMLDDFGTGYSSLSYLQRLPIDTLKIDRSFIKDLAAPKNLEIVRTIILLARCLGLEVIAEGVENTEQVVKLIEMGCPLGQGYLFSKPADAAAIHELLAATR